MPLLQSVMTWKEVWFTPVAEAGLGEAVLGGGVSWKSCTEHRELSNQASHQICWCQAYCSSTAHTKRWSALQKVTQSEARQLVNRERPCRIEGPRVTWKTLAALINCVAGDPWSAFWTRSSAKTTVGQRQARSTQISPLTHGLLVATPGGHRCSRSHTPPGQVTPEGRSGPRSQREHWSVSSILWCNINYIINQTTMGELVVGWH
jgi:hypothetical protein